MKIKQTILSVVFMISLIGGGALYTQSVYAAGACPDGQAAPAGGACCGGAKTSIIGCSQGAGESTTDNGVWALLILTLQILTAGVGIAAVGGIAYGAALYASASDKPEQAKQGMTFIKNVVIGLAAYGLMYVVLNFLIPGGIFT